MLDQALTLANEGDSLIQTSHYAEDSIQPKCSEIRVVSEKVQSSLEAHKELLLKAMELHRCLERVSGNRLHTSSLCQVFFFGWSRFLLTSSPATFRHPSGSTMVFTCWRRNRWTSVYPRMEPSWLCRSWSATWIALAKISLLTWTPSAESLRPC